MKISIIMAVYNGQDTIEAALQSILRQKGVDIELIVIDGASTDRTMDILHRYVDHVAMLRSEPDNGIYDALNKGLKLASGDVVGFLHADDMYADDLVVSDIVSAFSSSPDVDAIYGDLQYVSKEQPHAVVRHWRSGDYSYALLKRGWMPPHPTFYVRRSIYLQYGLFDTKYRIAADYDCIFRFLGRHQIGICYIPRVLVKMRIGGASNRSLGNIIQKSREDYRALRTNHIGGLAALIWKNMSKIPQFLNRVHLS
ncbi:MAG: glycosyltransferase [Burkholderiales bacterium]|nr:MAG: glycosyltransferase [Burkholderiales bacterium]